MNPPFQFSLRRLLAAVVLCSIGVAAIAWMYSVQSLPGGPFLQTLFILAFHLFLGAAFGGAICLVVRRPVRFAAWAVVILIFLAVLLPALNSGSGPRRPSSANNLREIVVSMINFESTTGRLPAQASFDSNGRPLLSWRVHILPYIDERALYNEFHLDEPWDSPHNQALIDKMPALYASPPDDGSDHRTRFLVPAGKGTIFDGAIGMNRDEIKDGPENTILIVETDVDHAVIWTKPEDLEINFDEPLRGLKHAHAEGFNVVFVDSHTQFVSADIDPKVLTALFTPNGGEAVRADDAREK